VTGVPGTVGRPRGLPAPPPGRPSDGFAPSAISKALARIDVPPLALRAVPFFMLALFASAHWVALVDPAPTGRALLAALVATGAGLLIALSGRLPRAPGIAVRAGLVVAGAIIGLTAIGIRFKLLMPAGWGTLSDRVTGGLSVVGSVTEWPYGGPNVWLRLTTLMAAPLTLTLAAALAFWPGRGRGESARGLRFVALALLVALYAVPVAARPFGLQSLRGIGLLVCLAAWLWLPRLRGRDAAAALIAIAVAGLVGLGLTAKVASSQPWVDYRHWSWTLHKEKTLSFDWRHSYGPLHWPRKGTTLLLIRAKQAHYWKAETLDRFDGVRWTTLGRRDRPIANIGLNGNPKWIEKIRVTVRGLRSQEVIGPGVLFDVQGTPAEAITQSNGTFLSGGQLESGDTYTARAYTPDPSAGQMRAAPPAARFFGTYTTITLPSPAGFVPSRQIEVPLRGVPDSGDPHAAAQLEASPYAPMYRLAKRVTAGAPTDYDAVQEIGAWLEAHNTYSERVPRHVYPLESFLFQDNRGYCQQFSGAAALMLRMLGIPARVASGFTPGSLNADTNEYVVRDLDAHSWIEVWFAGIGWVPFDPTPALAPAASQAGSFQSEAAAASAARGDAKDRLPKKRLDQLFGASGGSGGKGGLVEPGKKTPWVAILLAAAALILVLVGIAALVRRSRRHRYPPPAPCGDPDVDDLVRLLARLGLRVEPGTTLYSLEHRLRRLGGPEAAEYASRLRRRRFGGDGEPAPTRGERRHLRSALADAVGAGRLAKLHLALPEKRASRSVSLKLPRVQRPR
jgi:transglutaminase-like putative cysteine protease